MAIFTFSTRPKRPQDTELVQKVKQDCEKRGMNFSSLVIELLKEHVAKQEARVNGR